LSDKRRLYTSLGIAAIAVAAVMFLMLFGWNPAPAIPRDFDHARSPDEQDCLRCHGPEGKDARPRNHPLRDDCFSCHAWAPEDQRSR
jgi:hypothetical protein